MNHYFVTAKIKVKPEVNLELAKLEMRKLVEKTLNEKDCHRFEIRQSLQDERVFIMWEEFTNKEALDRHFQYEHTKHFINQKMTTIEYAEFTRSFLND